MLTKKSGKREKAEGIELLSQETLGVKKNYEYLETLEVNTIKQVKMKGLGRECINIYQQPDDKIWEQQEHNRKAERINKMY